MYDPEEITYFGETDSRSRRVRFGIKADDRTKHMYVIGKSGMGKSTLLENMAVQDIQNGNGFCFLDPHGGSAELLMAYIPEERKKDVLYIAPFDTENPIGFNILENMGADKRHLVVSGIMSVFKKLWVDQWSARMEYFLQNALFALLEYPGATLLHVNRMFSDKAFRDEVITHITDSAIKDFWTNEWANMTERFIAEATPAIQNKIGQFAANPVLRNILGQPKSTFNFRELMDERKIVIVNLAKGLMGEANTDLIGSLLVTKLYLAAMSRADVGKFEIENLPNFYLYVDEFQSFSNDSFANILSEARKYKLNLTIAHQYVEQMEETVAAAVFGNVGTTVTFRVGATDADALEKEFAPVFEAPDLVNLGKFQIYLKLMIDGVGSSPFSATTLPPLPKPEIDLTNEVIDLSRAKYSTSKSVVEQNIQDTVFFDFKTKNQNKGGKGKGPQNRGGAQNKSGGSNNNNQNKGGQNNNRGANKSGGSGGQSNTGNAKVDIRSKPPQNSQLPPKPESQSKSYSVRTEERNLRENSQESRIKIPDAPSEKPEPPPLSESSLEENPFKAALQKDSFTKSMKEKITFDRSRDKRESQDQERKGIEPKKYNRDKNTEPERRSTLQDALAALKPQKRSDTPEKKPERESSSFTEKYEKKEEQKKRSNQYESSQGGRGDNHHSKEKLESKEQKKETQNPQDQNRTNRSSHSHPKKDKKTPNSNQGVNHQNIEQKESQQDTQNNQGRNPEVSSHREKREDSQKETQKNSSSYKEQDHQAAQSHQEVHKTSRVTDRTDEQKREPRREEVQEDTTRNVKIPAHISDEQLQNLLKITEKDLKLNV